MHIADHLRNIDNPRSSLCIRWQGHATSGLDRGGYGYGLPLVGKLVERPFICGIRLPLLLLCTYFQ